MDTYLLAVQSHLKLARKTLEGRLTQVEQTPVGLVRRQSRLDHTRAMLNYVLELEGMVIQDPDNWDDEADVVPF